MCDIKIGEIYYHKLLGDMYLALTQQPDFGGYLKFRTFDGKEVSMKPCEFRSGLEDVHVPAQPGIRIGVIANGGQSVTEQANVQSRANSAQMAGIPVPSWQTTLQENVFRPTSTMQQQRLGTPPAWDS